MLQITFTLQITNDAWRVFHGIFRRRVRISYARLGASKTLDRPPFCLRSRRIVMNPNINKQVAKFIINFQ